MKTGKTTIGITVAIIVLLFLQPIPAQTDSNPGTGIEKDQTGISDINTIAPPQMQIETSMDINVVFIGFDQSNIDETSIDNEITKWYAPINSMKDLAFMGSNYSLNLNYYYSQSNLETDYVNFLNSHGFLSSDLPAEFANWHSDPDPSQVIYYDSHMSYEWLQNNINSYFPGVNQTYTIYLIDTYTKGYISDFYFYDLRYIDVDTGMESQENVTNAYGGSQGRGFFLDLSAGPIFYHQGDVSESNEGVSATTIPRIQSYSFPTDYQRFNTNITEYIQETIDLVFTPSYLYNTEYNSQVDVEIVMFNNASTSYDYLINPSVIESVLEDLVPYLEVDVSFSIVDLMDFPDLNNLIVNNNAYDSSSSAYIIDTEVVRDYMMDNKDDFAIQGDEIPAYIFNWDDTSLWMNGENVTGRAWDDGNGNPGMVISGFDPTYFPTYLGYPQELGYSQTAIHEVGHLLGLRHPHDGVSFDKFDETGNPHFNNWLQDFVSTPMTYAHSDITFSAFDKDQMARGYVINYINSTWNNLNDANRSLVDRNFNSEDYTVGDTSGMQSALQWTLGNRSLSIEAFDNQDYNLAYSYAMRSSAASSMYFDEAEKLTIIEDVEPTTVTVTEGATVRESTESGLPFPVLGFALLVAVPVLRKKSQ